MTRRTATGRQRYDLFARFRATRGHEQSFMDDRDQDGWFLHPII
jgi:hypothetical protein